MFFWNDPTLPFEMRKRADFESVVSQDRFKIHNVDGMLMVEVNDHYALEDIKGLVQANHKPSDVIKLIEEGRICQFQDELTIPDEIDEDMAKKIRHAFERSKGNMALGFDVALIKKDWAEMYFNGLRNDGNSDGTVSLDVAVFIRDHYNLAIDTDGELNFYEYVTTLHGMRQKNEVEVSVHRGDVMYAGDLDEINCETHWMQGDYVRLEVETYTTFRGEITKESSWLTIHERGFTPVKFGEAMVRPLTDEVEQNLTERARSIVANINETGISFVHYEGEALVPFFFGPYPEYVNDRVIVDPVSLYTVDTSKYRGMISDLGFDSDGSVNIKNQFEPNIDEDELYMLFPYSFGYVFASKKWAMLDMSNSRPINFRRDAIDKLVLDESKKKMLLALVENNVADNNDIVDGKGGGVITLLHGAPGLGKTLAAEVIAEYTQRPLYKVSVGELGTTPDELENRLSKILNIATRWGAVLLIDEADIFLEARTTNDIQRNAMVAIFLRLLEYYEGVLFLTTNRVANFDEAFYSRIMLSFGFGEFETESRQKVWTNLLANSGIEVTAEEMVTLNGYSDVNARQIKNAINGGRALALSENKPVGIKHITQLLDNTVEFLKDVKK